MIAEKGRAEPAEYYIVPARHLSGTREEVLAQIDELIQGLVGLRQLVSLHGPKPAEAPRQKLRLVKRFINAVLALATVTWVQPAPARTGERRELRQLSHASVAVQERAAIEPSARAR